ncbi:asparaginase [Paenibacillus sp. NPDC058071]|uniref:asparaginase n=1 Tax=Paenibacillus sp. NPDC058071 TaxID=3346326 RepID=UPI0036DA8B08
MKKIMVLFTGGTIGSKNDNGKVSVHDAGSYTLIEAYSSAGARGDVTFDTKQPLNLLSENLVPDDWNTLKTALDQIDLSEYDGVIVTHGSDTLAFSAAMISYLFADTARPIILVAANYPIGDPRSNGVANFAAAVDFIVGEGLPGVFVVYRDDKETMNVYLGTRITQAVSFTDQFGSPYELVYGEMKDGTFLPKVHPYNPQVEELRNRKPAEGGKAVRSAELRAGLLYIKPFTGLDYSYYRFDEHAPKAVLHDLYHSGTASANAPGGHSLLQFAEYCAAHGVDLYLCPLKDRSEALYASSVSLIEAGVVFIENMSAEATLMKLTLAYALFDTHEEVRRFVCDTPLFYEEVRQ